MEFTRREQLERHLEKLLGGLVPRFFPAHKFGFVTVTGLRIARGLDSAKVAVTVERNSHQFLEYSKKVIGAIQKEVNSNLPRKKIPKLIFELDRTNELLAKIAEIDK